MLMKKKQRSGLMQEAFPEIKVLWDYLPMGITCHIGPGGLGIGYSVRP